MSWKGYAILAGIAALTLIPHLPGCLYPYPVEPRPDPRVEVRPSELELGVGDTVQLTAMVWEGDSLVGCAGNMAPCDSVWEARRRNTMHGARLVESLEIITVRATTMVIGVRDSWGRTHTLTPADAPVDVPLTRTVRRQIRAGNLERVGKEEQ